MSAAYRDREDTGGLGWILWLVALLLVLVGLPAFVCGAVVLFAARGLAAAHGTVPPRWLLPDPRGRESRTSSLWCLLLIGGGDAQG